MILFFKKLKAISYKLQASGLNKGMTYVELIVVLSIFAALSSISMFSYGEFQAKVDIKNLGSDIALKIVEAQKSSLSGLLPNQIPPITPWRPSYGVYFDINNSPLKQFIYFVDLNNRNGYDVYDYTEALETINITKGDYIDKIESYSGSPLVPTLISTPLSITFKRPDSGAVFTNSFGVLLTGFEYIQISIKSPKEQNVFIKVYPSGRIQVN